MKRAKTNIFALAAIAILNLVACSSESNKAIDEGTQCNEECPVGAQRISMKSADGSCGADGSYSSLGSASAGGTCVGHGECQVVCTYPLCGDTQTLVINQDEFRCEAQDQGPCKNVDCDGFGQCQVVYDAAQCICQDGYRTLGLHCVKDEQPLVYTVTPNKTVVGETAVFTVEGAYLSQTLAAQVENCDELEFTKRGETQQEFTCIPQTPGFAQRTLFAEPGGDELYADQTTAKCPACQIDGECIAWAQENPQNPCLKCDPDQFSTFWSPNDGKFCDDYNFCNGLDSCGAGSCSQHEGNPCPDDGDFCNGTEWCDAGAQACAHTGSPCVDDGLFCNGVEECDEEADQCTTTGAPCGDDAQFCNGVEFCDEDADECVSTGDPCIIDGVFCNGVEFCNEGLGACDTSGTPCPDNGNLCDGVEFCDETLQACGATGNPCINDGNPCNGEESCDELLGLCVASDVPCFDDGLFCNGVESCDPVTMECLSSGNPCGDDNVWCNGTELCDEENNLCIHTGNPCPQDDQFCNGTSYCNELLDQCSTTGDPCLDDEDFCNGVESCSEVDDLCVHSGDPCIDDGLFCNGLDFCDRVNQACDNTGPLCFDDGNFCNGDEYCDDNTQDCAHTPPPCPDDDKFCTGVETCDPLEKKCNASGNPCPDDGLYCNGDEVCDEFGDFCIHTGDPCADDQLFCNGVELCDENTDQCIHSEPPCTDDGNFCNGQEVCQEDKDGCASTGNPCPDDGNFCNGTEFCDPVQELCLHTGTPCPEDGLHCNGQETCAESSKNCTHSGTPCSDDGSFCTGLELCDETQNACLSAGDPCVDDGLFCNGVELCAEDQGCAHSGDPCLPHERCSEQEGLCKAELLVNTVTDGLQGHPDVAVLSGGRIVVVWQSNNTGQGDYDIRGAVYDKNGFLVQTEKTLNSSLAGNQVHPAVAASPYDKGRVFLTWDALELVETSMNWGYFPSYFAAFKADGMTQAIAQTLVWMYASTPLQSDQQVPVQQSSRPDIAALTDGRFAFVWTPGYPTMGHRQLWYNACKAGATKESGVANPNLAFSQSSSTVDTASPGAIAASPGSEYVVAEVIYPGGVQARRIAANGALQTIIPISGNWGEYQRPAVAAGAGNKAVVAWEEWIPDSEAEEQIYVQRLTGNSKNGGKILVNQTSLGRQTEPDVIMTADSNEFIVIWTSVGQDGYGKGVYGRRFSFATGAPVGNEFRINETTLGNQYEPAVALSTDGSWVVVWTSSTWEERDIYMRIFPAP